MSSKPKPIIFIFEKITKGQLSRGIIFVLMMTVVLIFFLSPPVSLTDRLLNIGYHRVGPGNGVDLSYQQAWAQVGEVKLVNDSNTFNPGQKIEFTLSASSTSTGVQVDDATGTYWYAYVDEKNRHHTVYLESAASITGALRLVAKHNLHSLVFQNLPDSTNGDLPWEAIRRLLTSNDPLLESQYTLVWLVQRQDGRVMAEKAADLTNPNFVWIAPETGGVYDVAASIFSNQKAGVAIPRGSVRVLVATPTPGPTSTP